MFTSIKTICDQWMEKCNHPNLAKLLVRLTLGAIFIAHGWGKISGMDMTVGFFGKLGLPAFVAYLVGYSEFLGGIAMVLGIMAREVAVLFTVILLGAVYFVHFAQGWKGMEFPLILLAASLSVLFSDTGKYTLGKMFGRGSSPESA